MATGYSGLAEVGVEEGSEAIWDHCCTPCAKVKQNSEAQSHCKTCRKHLCDSCRKQHDRLLEGHRVLGLDKQDQWGTVKNVALPMCDEHADKELDMYCKDDDVVCCMSCAHQYHRVCEEVVYVNEIAKGVRSRPAFRKLSSQARQTIEDLDSTKDKKLENKKKLQSVRAGIVASIKDVRRKQNETLNRIERDTLKEIDVLISAMEQDLQSSIETYTNLRDQVQRHLDDMDRNGEQCDNFAFAVSKLCEMRLSATKDFMMSLPEEDFEVQFIPDAKAEQYFAQLQCFGTFLTTPYLFYTLDDTEAVNVRQDTDKEKCAISGLCQLPDGYIAIVDAGNRKIKLLQPSSCSVVAQKRLPGVPQDICHTKGSELVVTVCENEDNAWVRHVLYFVDANNGSLLHKRTVRLDNPCIGITHHKDQLYVSSEKSLYLFTTAGELLKELYGESKPTIFRFSVSDDGQLIYITQFWKKPLFSLDITNQSVSTISYKREKKPTGVCTSGRGALFVCDEETNTVHQLDLKGNRVSTLATSKDGVQNPMSLWYNRRTRQLFVGQWDDHLLVLKLK